MLSFDARVGEGSTPLETSPPSNAAIHSAPPQLGGGRMKPCKVDTVSSAFIEAGNLSNRHIWAISHGPNPAVVALVYLERLETDDLTLRPRSKDTNYRAREVEAGDIERVKLEQRDPVVSLGVLKGEFVLYFRVDDPE